MTASGAPGGAASDQELLDLAAAWHAAGEEVAIATVTRTWGSSPRPAGSRLLLTRSGRIAGSVSGGCVEGEVAARAIEVLEGGRPSLIRFDVSAERPWQVGLACGGEVEIFIEPLSSGPPSP